MTPEIQNYNTLAQHIQADQMCIPHAKIGHCRQWSRFVLDSLQNIDNISAEAREVEISPGLTHTFIKLTIHDHHRAYFADGVGTTKYPPYFGYEDEAPDHLQNSKPDMMINTYANIDNSTQNT